MLCSLSKSAILLWWMLVLVAWMLTRTARLKQFNKQMCPCPTSLSLSLNSCSKHPKNGCGPSVFQRILCSRDHPSWRLLTSLTSGDRRSEQPRKGPADNAAHNTHLDFNQHYSQWGGQVDCAQRMLSKRARHTFQHRAAERRCLS